MLIFSEKFRLTQADFYADKSIRLSSVLDFFQTVTSEHADEHGVGFDDMEKKNVAWILARIKFTVLGQIKANDVVVVETLPHPKGAASYERDYFIYNEGGELVVKGSSQWALMDISARKLVRPFFEYEGEFVDRRAYDGRIEHVPPVMGESRYRQFINDNDVDRNGHVNNIKYADLMTAALLPKNVRTATVNFINETKKGEIMDVTAIESDGGFLYTGRCGDTVKFTGKIETF